jgi:hypothetical protein
MPTTVFNATTGRSVTVGSVIGTNARKRPVYIGVKGGKYVVMPKGYKQYMYPGKPFTILPKHTKTTIGFNMMGRRIHLGDRGGSYVIHKGRKVYGYPGKGTVRLTYPAKTRRNLLIGHIRGRA